ncbi:MAG TPA: hypothetical protein VK666_26105 [Chryseolinea sp.]|nr:hypothetical protein [Chryseolinea sp.]
MKAFTSKDEGVPETDNTALQHHVQMSSDVEAELLAFKHITKSGEKA